MKRRSRIAVLGANNVQLEDGLGQIQTNDGQICSRLHGGASRSSGCKNLHFGTLMPFLRGPTVNR